MKNLFLYIICFSYSVFLYGDSFTIKQKYSDYSVISLNIGDISIEKKDGFDNIISNSKGETQDIGQPQLPTYTFNYSIDYQKNYIVSLETSDYVIYENINLLPAQDLTKVNQEKTFIKDFELYNSDTVYPKEKVSSKRMSLRGYELLSVEVIPYEYNPKLKQLKVFTNVDVIISETNTRQTRKSPCIH